LSIDEELYGSLYEPDWWKLAIAQGRWALGLLDRMMPPIGDIPLIATVIFCAGMGLSAILLARVLFQSHSAQLTFVGIYVSYPLWPHLAEFNTTSWQIGIGHTLIVVALLLFISGNRGAAVGAACLVAIATGIYESLFLSFVVILCLYYLSAL